MMPIRSILLVIAALAMAGITALVARSMLGSSPQEAPQVQAEKAPTSLKLLVAKTALPIGTIIKRDQLRWQAWPDEGLHDGYLAEGKVNPDEFTGHVVRTALLAGEPMTRAHLVAPGAQGFLAAALTPGMRAITLSINQVSGVSGFVFPGDRVDLILNHQVADSEGKMRHASETVVENLRILAIDTRTNSAPTDANGVQTPQIGKTATVEVTPKIAEKVAILSNLGELTLSLRSLAGQDGATASNKAGEGAGMAKNSYSWDADVSSLLPPVDPNQNKNSVKLSRGSEISVLEFPREPGQ
ncbi:MULTISPECIES: Flp pilus assembly protein CpaB [unclassified Iodidimonas]|jgi:pilus assembly protein CpaB|uniref:Flp pilus assembly protein CpaB n=2 Tax=Iodidimonas TaxID=2066486 RepID=UPI00248252B7|nr:MULTISPECIES: Flp pilus assembly protein CpaB [unclassified Iodidimonas]